MTAAAVLPVVLTLVRLIRECEFKALRKENCPEAFIGIPWISKVSASGYTWSVACYLNKSISAGWGDSIFRTGAAGAAICDACLPGLL